MLSHLLCNVLNEEEENGKKTHVPAMSAGPAANGARKYLKLRCMRENDLLDL